MAWGKVRPSSTNELFFRMGGGADKKEKRGKKGVLWSTRSVFVIVCYVTTI